jgi:ABC-type sugar transport system substrate-binding protein
MFTRRLSARALAVTVAAAATAGLAACGSDGAGGTGAATASGGESQPVAGGEFREKLRCAASPTPEELVAFRAPKAKERFKVTVMQVSLAGYYYQALAYGAYQAGKDAGVDISMVAGKGYTSPGQQLADAENVLQRGTDALVLAPVDIKGSVPIVDKADARGIPVVNTSSEVDSPKVITVMQDDYLQGQASADQLAEQLGPEGGKGILMGGPANATWSRKRVQGFRDRLAAEHPKVEILVETNQLVDPAEGAKDFNNAVQAHPEIDWIYSTFVFVLPPESIPARYRDVTYVTTGFEPLVIDALKKGTIDATIAVDQFDMGYMAVARAVEKLNGTEPPKVTCLPNPSLTADQVDTPFAQRELIPAGWKPPSN